MGHSLIFILAICLEKVQAPAMSLPTDDQFYLESDRSKPDIAFLKNHLYREGRLTEDQALFILKGSVRSCWIEERVHLCR